MVFNATGGESSKRQGLVGIGSLEKCITAVPGVWKKHEVAKEKLWAVGLLSDHVISAQSFILSIPLLC